jgi:hypothetical protein
MDLAALKLELGSRFGEFLADGRRTRLINEAYHDLCERFPWPFLETTTTGTAPLTISDLRQVLYCVDTTNERELRSMDVRSIVDWNPIVTETGTPELFWLDGLSTLKVFPANTSVSLSVRYLKVPTDLSSDSDTPVLPARYHMLIVDLAQARALAEGPNPSGSNLARMGAVEQLVERKVLRMAEQLLHRGLDAPQVMAVEFASDDW